MYSVRIPLETLQLDVGQIYNVGCNSDFSPAKAIPYSVVNFTHAEFIYYLVISVSKPSECIYNKLSHVVKIGFTDVLCIITRVIGLEIIRSVSIDKVG